MAFRPVLLWTGLFLAIAVPFAFAATSPLLQWRDPLYIAAGFAGIAGLCCLLLQPLLAGRFLPGLSPRRARSLHHTVGGLLVLAVVVHVAGLWMTSPPDVIDALLLRSPTPFSLWGVIAMWGVFTTAALAVFRRRLNISPRIWHKCHWLLILLVVPGTVIHALLIEGTMELYSKVVLCMIVLTATAIAAKAKYRSRTPTRD